MVLRGRSVLFPLLLWSDEYVNRSRMFHRGSSSPRRLFVDDINWRRNYKCPVRLSLPFLHTTPVPYRTMVCVVLGYTGVRGERDRGFYSSPSDLSSGFCMSSRILVGFFYLYCPFVLTSGTKPSRTQYAGLSLLRVQGLPSIRVVRLKFQ